MSLLKRFPLDDPIWEYSDPRIAQQKAFDQYGDGAILFRSHNKNKKYAIKNPDGYIVNFGQMGYEDHTYHQNPIRRMNYLNRSSNIRGNWRNDYYSPNNLSRRILW